MADEWIDKGTVVRCPECGYEMKLAVKSRSVTCSKGQGRVEHKPQVMVEVSTTVQSGAVKLRPRTRRKS